MNKAFVNKSLIYIGGAIIFILAILLIRSIDSNRDKQVAIDNLQTQTLSGQLDAYKDEYHGYEADRLGLIESKEWLQTSCENQLSVYDVKIHNVDVSMAETMDKIKGIYSLMGSGDVATTGKTAPATLVRVIE